MRKFDVYLIDLDGTIVDSRPGIFSCFREALAAFGIVENDDERMNSFIGPPLHVSLSEAYGLKRDEIAEAIRIYRKSYAKRGIFECALLPDALAALRALSGSGARLCLATSKPIVFAEQIAKNFGFDEYFCEMVGADLEGNFCEKPEIVAECLMRLGGQIAEAEIPARSLACSAQKSGGKRVQQLTGNSGIIMVGDRKYDILGAKHHGLASAGLLCGYGSREELVAAGADFILPNLLALTDFD